MSSATVFDIQRNSFVDGPGIRTTVFFKGCNLKCAWCHNPESQNFKPELLFYKEKCIGCGKCLQVCPNGLQSCQFCGNCELYCPEDAKKVCGRKYTVEEVLAVLKKDMAYYENSEGGVTFSGGECMLQIDFLCELLKKCKECGLHTAVDTAGFVPWTSFEKILDYTDLFLYDIKCFDRELHLKYTGVENRKILENLEKLLSLKANVILRIPVIGGVNDSVEEMQKICDFLKPYSLPPVELLPYHALGLHKFSALNRKGEEFSVPEKSRMQELKAVFETEKI